MNDFKRQPFDNRSLADTRLAHHNGVVLASTRQDIDHLTQTVITAQHRIEQPLPGLLRQIMSEAFEQRITLIH